MAAPRRVRAAGGGYAPPTRAKARRLTPEEVIEAKAMLDRGLTYHEAARKLRCTDGALRHRFPGYNGNSKPGSW